MTEKKIIQIELTKEELAELLREEVQKALSPILEQISSKEQYSRYISVSEACEISGKSPNTIRSRVHEGLLTNHAEGSRNIQLDKQEVVDMFCSRVLARA